MADNSFQAYGQASPINDIRTQRYNLAMMSAMNRMDPYGQRPPSIHHSALRSNPMMASMMGGDEPDYSTFTTDPQAHAAANNYLGQFGLSALEPSQVNPNAIFPNSGFFGQHQKLASMLEGGLFGGMATKGSDTIGEGISNVAGGLLEGRMARSRLLNRQFARPFEAANMLESLQDKTQKRDLQAADIEHLRAVNQHLAAGDELGIDRINAQKPVPVEGGAWVMDPKKEKAGEYPWTFQAGPGGKASVYAIHAGMLSQPVRDSLLGKGINPVTALPSQIEAARTEVYGQSINKATAIGGGVESAKRRVDLPYRNFEEQQRLYNMDMAHMNSPAYAESIEMDLLEKNGFDITKVKKEDVDTAVANAKKARTDEFNTAYPQGSPLPPVPKGKASAPKAPASKKIPTYNPNTGKLE